MASHAQRVVNLEARGALRARWNFTTKLHPPDDQETIVQPHTQSSLPRTSRDLPREPVPRGAGPVRHPLRLANRHPRNGLPCASPHSTLEKKEVSS